MDQVEVNQIETQPLLLTARDVSKQLQVSVRTVWRLRSAGKLPKPVEVGGAVRWRNDEFQKWVAEGCRSSSPAARR